jgi:hypothetical protein
MVLFYVMHFYGLFSYSVCLCGAMAQQDGKIQEAGEMVDRQDETRPHRPINHSWQQCMYMYTDVNCVNSRHPKCAVVLKCNPKCKYSFETIATITFSVCVCALSFLFIFILVAISCKLLLLYLHISMCIRFHHCKNREKSNKQQRCDKIKEMRQRI